MHQLVCSADQLQVVGRNEIVSHLHSSELKWDGGEAIELKWDGKEAVLRNLGSEQPSSATWRNSPVVNLIKEASSLWECKSCQGEKI